MNLISERRRWSDLRPLSPEEVVGDLEASFVPPLRRIAPAGLGLIGLRAWYGKRFRREGARVAGVNLLRRGDELVETLPMTLSLGISRIDGQPTLVVGYAADAPRPWRWVRDELRLAPDGTLVGMSIVDLPVLRGLGGAPFHLSARPSADSSEHGRPH